LNLDNLRLNSTHNPENSKERIIVMMIQKEFQGMKTFKNRKISETKLLV